MTGGEVWRPLGSLLVAQGIVSEREIEDALAEQAAAGGRLGEILIELGYATRASIMDALAQQASLLLDVERGFGSGLRQQIDRRNQERSPAPPVEAAAEADPEADDGAADEPPQRELAEALREQVVVTTAPFAPAVTSPVASDPGDSEFLAIASRAQRYLEDRRASLPELPAVG
jgi:hypothetical protein